MSRTEKAVVVSVLAAAAVVGALVVAWVASFDLRGDDFEPPPKPTAADLDRIRDRAGFPVHWLGRSYAGREVEHAEPLDSYKEAVAVSYGGPYCDSFDEDCNYDIDVITERSRAIDAEDLTTGEPHPICWRRAGRAFVLGCRDDDRTELHVLTGSVSVYISHNLSEGDAHPVVEALRPMKGGELAAPRPFSCREMRLLSARLRKSLPAELRGCRRAGRP